MDGQMMIWIAIGALFLVGFLLVSNKLRKGLGFVMRAAISTVAVVVINFALGGFGIAVGINVVTLTIAAFLGLPGVVMLYGLSFLI